MFSPSSSRGFHKDVIGHNDVAVFTKMHCTGLKKKKKKKKNPLRNTGWRTVLNKPISWSQLCKLCTTRQAEVDLTDLILVKKA